MHIIETSLENAERKNIEVTLGVIGLVLDSCWNMLSQGLIEEAAIAFKHAIALLETIGITASQNNRFNDIGIRLIEMGEWEVVSSAILNSFGKPFKKDTPYSIKFLQATCLKKQGELEDAQELYSEIIDSGELIGDWIYVVRYHAAHTIQLRGDFNLAKDAYMHILKKTKDDPKFVRKMAYTLAQKQMVVNQISNGKFKQAIDNLKDIDSFWGVLEQIEMKRIKGHIYRYNFMLDKAEKLYLEALKLSKDNGINSSTMKILTNLAQTLCWTNPSEAMEYAEDALALGRWVNSATERGKATSAMSIALAVKGRYERALEVAHEALTMQEENDYQFGLLLALQAKAHIHLLAGDVILFNETIENMKLKIDNLGGAYGFLITSFDTSHSLSDQDSGNVGFEWLDLSHTAKKWESLVGC